MHSRVDCCHMQILANMAVEIPGLGSAPRNNYIGFVCRKT